MALGCVSVRSVSRVLHGASDCSAHSASHPAASTTCPVSEHQQMLTFYTPNWEIPFCFAFFYFEIIGDLKGCFVVPLENGFTFIIRNLGKSRSLIPNPNPLTKCDGLCPGFITPLAVVLGEQRVFPQISLANRM